MLKYVLVAALCVVLIEARKPIFKRKLATESCPNADDVECDAGTKCVTKSNQCDTENDCSDGKDELNCPCPNEGVSRWRCADSYCIHVSSRCDGAKQCPDGSDEGDSCSAANFKCTDKQFKCKTETQCIQESYVCDGGRPDCRDGSDEDATACATKKKRKEAEKREVEHEKAKMTAARRSMDTTAEKSMTKKKEDDLLDLLRQLID